MQGGDGAAGDRPKQRELKLVDMEVQDVELVGALAHAIEHQHVIGDRIDDAGIEPQRLGHAGHEIGRRDRIAAGKQRDVMAERHELFGQIGDDPFGAAIKPWRHALDQRRDLRDFHGVSLLPTRMNLSIERRFPQRTAGHRDQVHRDCVPGTQFEVHLRSTTHSYEIEQFLKVAECDKVWDFIREAAEDKDAGSVRVVPR